MNAYYSQWDRDDLNDWQGKNLAHGYEEDYPLYFNTLEEDEDDKEEDEEEEEEELSLESLGMSWRDFA